MLSPLTMHETSIAASLLDIVRSELEKHGATRLHLVRVKYGRLTQVVPDSLLFAFDMLIKGTDLEGARLELEELPLRVRCWVCKTEFEPEHESVLIMPCPSCGEDFGHEVLSGKELYLDTLEAE